MEADYQLRLDGRERINLLSLGDTLQEVKRYVAGKYFDCSVEMWAVNARAKYEKPAGKKRFRLMHKNM